MSRLLAGLGFLCVAVTSPACEPQMTVGSWPCTSSSGPAGTMPDGTIVPFRGPIAAPWENGFEDGFCGYARAKGWCYQMGVASYSLVEAPVHSGRRAARFDVIDQDDPYGKQTRCAREGQAPADAIYGAWFYLTSSATVTGNWNLMFFPAGDEEPLDGQWDVSLGNTDGRLTLHLVNHLARKPLPPDGSPAQQNAPTVEPGKWFHVEFRWRRAQDATGSVALYQDGVLVVEANDIQTETAGSTRQQWYVGNLVGDVTPPESTLYVDDVSIALPP